MASWRHLSRIIVMQSFFESLMRQSGDVDSILEYNLKEYGDKIEDPSFARNLIEKIKKDQDKIEKLIKKFAPEWPIQKMNPVDRVILTIGICELTNPENDVPVNVAINESIELAKAYGDDNSGKFVNGVMNAVAHDKSVK